MLISSLDVANVFCSYMHKNEDDDASYDSTTQMLNRLAADLPANAEEPEAKQKLFVNCFDSLWRL